MELLCCICVLLSTVGCLWGGFDLCCLCVSGLYYWCNLLGIGLLLFVWIHLRFVRYASDGLVFDVFILWWSFN